MSSLSFDGRFGMSPSPKKLAAWVVGLLSVASSIFTVFKVSPIDPHRWLTRPQPLFRLDPRIKGISIPSEDSLKFKNVNSRSNVDHFLVKRASLDARDREIAEKEIQEVVFDERDNPSPRTLGYLLALYGQFDLDSGHREAGIKQLESASQKSPQDLLIKALLLRAYEEANRDLERRATPWPMPLQEQIRQYGVKIYGLRGELKPFLEALAVSPRDLDLSGSIPLNVGCAAGRSGAGRSSTCDASDRYMHVRLSAVRAPCAGEQICDLKGAAEAYRRALDLLHVTRVTREDEEMDRARGVLSSLDLAGRDLVPARRVLAVGIDDYDAGSGFAPLIYARSDAERLVQAFARLGYGTDSLVDREATRESILASLARESLASRPGDDFVLYFSGHGFSDAQGQEGLVTAPETAEPISLVRLSEVARILSFHRGTATVIVDGCLNNLDVQFGDRNDGTYGPNRARLILAASPGRPAFESERLRAGLYTHALVDFLSRETAKSRAGASYHFDFDKLFAATSLETARLSRRMYALEQHPTKLELGMSLNGGKP